jgi:uncharacterized membrane protein YhfC
LPVIELTIFLASSLALPGVLAWLANSRYKAGSRFFGYGALIWITAAAAQTITFFPFLLYFRIRDPILYRKSLPIFEALNAVCSGLFEELTRYLGYQLLFRQDKKTWERAVVYGLGSAAAESAILAIPLCISLLTASAPKPILPAHLLLGAFKRFCTINIQISLSILVLQAFLRENKAWFACAIAYHSVVDLSTEIPTILGNPKWSEAFLTVWTAVSIGLIFRMRDMRTRLRDE